MTLSESLALARHRLQTWAWESGASARQRPAAALRFAPGAARKLLLVSRPDPICQSQMFPFHFYKEALRERWGYEVLEIGLATLLKEPHLAPRDADVVCFQAWIDQTPDDQRAIVALLREHHPGARVALFDPCAPADLRFAAAVGDRVDLYVKKHLLADLSDYDRPTGGDTNLTDWYGTYYGEPLPQTHFPLPPGFKDKLLLGPSFVTAPYMLPRFFAVQEAPVGGTRRYDLHARLGGMGANRSWYEKMRTQAFERVRGLQGVTVTPQTPVGKRAYMREMGQSRICFSPFGYGEVCWRDYEAVFSGALLLKPDMSHMRTDPDVFVPNETYVPLRWDFTDLDDQVAAYLGNERRRLEIARNAWEAMHRYARSGRFVDQHARLLAPGG